MSLLNYWTDMRHLFSIAILTFISVQVWSQSKSTSTITVLGSYSHLEPPDAYGIKILFEENPNKCDPIVGFLPLEEQIKRFSVEIKGLGIQFSEFVELPKENDWTTKHQVFKFTHKSPETILQASDICRRRAVQVQRIFTVFLEQPLQGQDENALKALKDAQQKAAAIAKKVGKKVGKVLNIDDDTSLSTLSNFGLEDLEDEQEELVVLIDLLNLLDSPNQESHQWSKTSTYTLSVTFELR
jgi:hypothetical protein